MHWHLMAITVSSMFCVCLSRLRWMPWYGHDCWRLWKLSCLKHSSSIVVISCLRHAFLIDVQKLMAQIHHRCLLSCLMSPSFASREHEFRSSSWPVYNIPRNVLEVIYLPPHSKLTQHWVQSRGI